MADLSTKRDILNWNNKLLSVSSNQIYTFTDWNASSSYESEKTENGKQMGKSKDKAAGIGTVNFKVTLSQYLGNDVKTEYNWWRAECNKGTYSLMYLGAYQFGDYKWRLVGVDISDLITTKDGTWRSCELSLSFEEYFYKAKQTKLQKKAAQLQKKLEKQLAKVVNAKNDKARAKAAEKAAKLQRQYEEASVKAAEEQVAICEAQKKAEELAQQAMVDALAKTPSGGGKKKK